MNWERIRAAWRWLTTSAYERQLEETNLALEVELAAVRRDNRALVNAQLKQAGLVTLPEMPMEESKPIHRIRRLSLHQRQRLSVQRTSQPLRKEQEIGGKA